MLNIAIVDDEPQWTFKIEMGILKIWKDKEMQIETYACAEEFLTSEKEYQLVFMDVEMREMDGFKTVDLYREQYPDVLVAMVTSHMELASRGYRVEAFRYLSKANLEEDLEEALEHVNAVLVQKEEVCIQVVNYGKLKIACEDIIYMETSGRNLKVHTIKGDYTSSEKITDMEEKLKKYGFYSIHRSVLVNFAWVRELHKTDVFMKNGEKLMVSIRKKKEMEQELYCWRFQRANQ